MVWKFNVKVFKVAISYVSGRTLYLTTVYTQNQSMSRVKCVDHNELRVFFIVYMFSYD
jgi:hypothetical protein